MGLSLLMADCPVQGSKVPFWEFAGLRSRLQCDQVYCDKNTAQRVRIGFGNVWDVQCFEVSSLVGNCLCAAVALEAAHLATDKALQYSRLGG